MKKLLLRALAVVPILLLVTSLASADSAMQLIYNGTVIAPTATIGCGTINGCQNTYQLMDGTTLVVSTDTGNGGGPPNIISLGTTNSQLSGSAPGGNTIEIDYAVNGYTGAGTSSFAHSVSSTLFGADTATNNIYYNGSNSLGFTGTLIDSATVGSGGALFLSSASNTSGTFNFASSPYTLVDQIIINQTDAIPVGGSLVVGSAFTIPEPASLMLLGGGFLGLANVLRRKLVK